MALNALEKPQIPVPATSLVGRQDELARLSALVERPDVRLVTLLGPGGVGKTRLAIQFVREIDPVLTGDVHFVLLANARDAGAALTEIARSLNVNQASTIPLEDMIANAIGRAPVLLILDNAEQIATDLTFLSTLLGSCPNLRILVTSRVILRLSGEHVFTVDPLPTASTGECLAPATELFLERARSVRPDLPLTSENVRAIDDICRQIDGLPLAIELAAARTCFLSPAALRDRLCKRLSHLVGGPRDAPERHRTLRATLIWSHDLLGPDERVLFRRLAVFEHGAPWDAVDPVCNASADLGGDVEEVLAALVDHSLVRIVDTPATSPRVRLLNTIREFAREQLELSGELKTMRQAHAAWYADLVIQTPSETWRTGTAELRAWTLRRLPDLHNLSLALEWLAECTDKTPAIRVVNGLVPFWLELGQLRDGSVWTARLIAHIDSAPIDVRAGLYRMSAIMALKDELLDQAHEHASRALELALQVGPPRVVANNQNLLGQIHWRRGDAAEGERLQRAAIATVLAISDRLGGALFASQIADALIEAGDLDRAEPLLREAMPVVARERPEALPLLQGSLGYLLFRRGILDEAGDSLALSLNYHRQPPHRLPGVLAGRLFNLAQLAARRSRFSEGARLLAASLALCERIGFTLGLSERAEAEQLARSIAAGSGLEAFERDHEIGRSLPLPTAIDLALDVTKLRRNGSSVTPDGGLDHALTPRERDVLALLVEGKSNPDIAVALFISQRTVTTHLSRLYAKLDVSTRSEAIAVVTRRGLVAPRAERPAADSTT